MQSQPKFLKAEQQARIVTSRRWNNLCLCAAAAASIAFSGCRPSRLGVLACACVSSPQVLPALTNLLHLDISGNDLDDSAGLALAPALQQLTCLTELQAGNRLWGVKGMAVLLKSASHLLRLQKLVLRSEAEPSDPSGDAEQELTPRQLHSLVPLLCQLGALRKLWELRLVRTSGMESVAHEQDKRRVLAALPSLSWPMLCM